MTNWMNMEKQFVNLNKVSSPNSVAIGFQYISAESVADPGFDSQGYSAKHFEQDYISPGAPAPN